MSTSELLVYGLVVAGFMLVNYVMQQVARRAQRQQQAEASADTVAVPPLPEPEIDYSWGRGPAVPPPTYAPADVPVRIPAGAPVQPIRAQPSREPAERYAVRSLLRGKRELRHAVVFMTVIGPCRANEPYDEHQPR